MSIRNLIKRIPLAVKVYSKVVRLGRSGSNKRILDQLAGYHQGPEIAEAVISLQHTLPQSYRGWIDRIEDERTRLLNSNGPLDDGSLNQAERYDPEMTIGDACSASKPAKPALMLFLLTRALNPRNVIELGTNVGISSAYIGAALKLGENNGKVASLDASPYRQRQASEMHQRLGIDNITYVQGFFEDTLRSTLADLGSVDLAFIDGHHQYQPTLDYFEEILKFSSPDTVFVFDDIRWSDGMKRAWSKIQSDNRLGVIVDLYTVGICTRRHQEDSQRFVSDPIYVF